MRMESKNTKRRNAGKTKASAILCVLLLLILTALPVYAAKGDWIDLDAKGTIRVTMQTKDKTKIIPGGQLTIYQVASVAVDDGNLGYAFTNGFENCGVDISNLEDSTLASKLEEKLPASAAGRTVTVGTDGAASFTNLNLGLYLIVQTQAASGYSKVSSFVVSVPMYEDETYIYEVDATPKVTGADVVPPTPTPVTPKPDKNLPYTGQLTWPIPVLAATGVLFFAVGWSLRRGKQQIA